MINVIDMTRRLFVIIIGLLAFATSQSSSLPVDSIRIIGSDAAVEIDSCLYRSKFVDFVLSQENHIDTTVVDSAEIVNIVNSMNNIRAVSMSKYNANQYVLEGKLNLEGTDIEWTEILTDSRILLVLFVDDQQEFVWIQSGCHLFDKGYYQYVIPQRMKDALKKYYPAFDY